MILAAISLSACGPDEKYRYKMVVEVETPEGIVTGHAVREVHYYEGGGFMFGEGRPQIRLTGEAVAIDLPRGRTLFALLMGRDGYEDYADNGISAILRVMDRDVGPKGGPHELWPMVPVIREPITDPISALVTFRDMRDSRSIELVDPDDLAKSFGPGYRLKSITIEVTDEPVTSAIGKRLSEKFFGDWEYFGSSIAHCGQLDHPYFRQLATRIGPSSFKQTDPPPRFDEDDFREDMKQRSLMRAVPCEELIPGYSGGPLRRMFDPPVFQHKPVVRDGQKQRPEMARWTPGLTPLTSNWTGDLRLRDGCLAVGSRQMLLLFPHGEGEWNNARQTLSYDGKSYAIGDRISLKGDTIRLFVDGGEAEYQSDSPDLGKHDFRSCNGYEIFRIDSKANQMRLRSSALAP